MQKEKTLVRLHRLRQMEEEMSRIDLEAVVAERERLFRHWQAAADARHAGRSSFAQSVESGDEPARLSSLVAIDQGRRRQENFATMLHSADRAVERLRAEFLSRRTATRQAETLMEEARVERRAEEAKRVQQMLDDWFGHRTRLAAEAADRELRRQPEGTDLPGNTAEYQGKRVNR